jgi:hypothetical protein
MVDGGPPGEVVGQEPPLATALQDVKDRVQDFTKTVGPGSSMSFGGGQVGLDIVPFGIGKIRRVRFFSYLLE